MQVEVKIFWSDLAIDILEVIEDGMSGEGCKTMKIMGQCVDLDWWDALMMSFLIWL